MDFLILLAATAQSVSLERTLASLVECTKPAGYRGAIVIENGPKGSVEAVAARFHASLGIRYLYVSRANKSNALNAGLENAEDALVFFTDDDVRVHKQTLVAYANAAAGRRRGQFYGGPVCPDYQVEPPAWLRSFLSPSTKGWHLKGADRPRPVNSAFFLGFNWAAFKQDLVEIGGFDPNFGPGSPTGSLGQESNAERRLLKAGVEAIYVPDAKVWHYVPQAKCTPGWVLKRAFASGISRGLRRHSKAGNVPGHGNAILKDGINSASARFLGSSFLARRLAFGLVYGQFYAAGYAKGAWLSKRLK